MYYICVCLRVCVRVFVCACVCIHIAQYKLQCHMCFATLCDWAGVDKFWVTNLLRSITDMSVHWPLRRKESIAC
jgi:hypothetical protein